MCKKQCNMREINMQKNSAKCVKFVCKKQCKMRGFSANFAVFLAYKFGAFCSVFLQENWRKIVWQFCIFFKLFCDDFLWNCVQGW